MDSQKNFNLKVFEVRKTQKGNILEISKTKIIENVNTFKQGEKMIFDLSKGEVVAIRKNDSWSINKKICNEWTKNLIKLIS